MKEVVIQQVGLGLPRVQNFSFLSDGATERPLLPTSSAQARGQGIVARPL